MRAWLTRSLLPCAAFAIVVPAAARDCSGYATFTSISTEAKDMGKGHALLAIRSLETLITDDPKDIYNLHMGECSGTLLTTPDGKSGGSGFCIRKDKDGDSASIAWELAPGADKGTWRATGGTGKYADLQARGWWMPVASDGGKLGVNRWGEPAASESPQGLGPRVARDFALSE
jgi:hypothetical protein